MPSHTHRWGRVVFVAGNQIRSCDKDCAARQVFVYASNDSLDGDWERIDSINDKDNPYGKGHASPSPEG